MGEKGNLREDDAHHMRMLRDPSVIAAPEGVLEPDPATMGLYVLEIGGRGDLTEQAAQESAREYQRVAGRGVEIYWAIYGYDDDPRGNWEIPEVAAFVSRWAALAGITPATAQRDQHPVCAKILAACRAAGASGRGS